MLSDPFQTARFQVVRPLGRGGMGVVYEAVDRQTGERVALKTLHHLDASTLYRFKQEFRALADVHHPNLVRLGELYEEDGRWYFTMELVDGVDFVRHVRGEGGRDAKQVDTLLSPSQAPTSTPSHPDERTVTRVAKILHTPTSGPSFGGHPRTLASDTGGSDALGPSPSIPPDWGALDPLRLSAAFAQLVEAVQALHEEGRVHRDIKPSNILVDTAGRVVLLDLGIAALLERDVAEPRTEEKEVAGTIAYMAPEQGTGAAPAPAADWYSVGVVLYRALTGKLPFRGAPRIVLAQKLEDLPTRPLDVDATVPPALDELCMRLLSIDPRDRPDAAWIRGALARVGPRAVGEARASAPERKQVPFVGRESELEWLATRFEAARGGGRARILLLGEPGVGKSALVRRFLRDAREQVHEVWVLKGRCYQQESVPFKAFDSVVDSLSQHLERASHEELDRIAPPEANALASLFPVLARAGRRFVAGDRPVDGERPVDRRARAFGALRSLLSTIASERPVIVSVDDVQWADAESFLLLRELLAPPSPPLVMIVLTARTELSSSLDERGGADHAVEALRSFERRRLEPLSPEATRRLALELLADANEERALSMVAQSGGHPMLLQELARHRGGDAEPLGASLSLVEVLHRRLAALSEDARRLVHIVALTRHRVDRDLLAAIAEIEPRRCAELLRELRDEQLLRLRPREAGFTVEPYHDRVRETVEAFVDPEARREIHERIVRALAGSEVGESDPLAHVHHLEMAGHGHEAGNAALRAAEAREGSLAFEQIARLYAEAIRLGAVSDDRAADVERRIGDAYRSAGRASDAAEHYLRAAEASDPTMGRHFRRAAAEQLILSGSIERGSELLKQSLRDLGIRLPPRWWMMLAIPLRERRLLRRGFRDWPSTSKATHADLEGLEARSTVWRAMNLVDPIITAYFLYDHAFQALALGEGDKAVEPCIMAVLAHATQHGVSVRDSVRGWLDDLEPRAQVAGDAASHWYRFCRGAVEGVCGDFVGMLDEFRDVERYYQHEARDPMSLALLRVTQLDSFRGSGRVADALSYADRMLREARLTSDRMLETFVVRTLNIAWLFRDEPAEARAHLDRPLWTSADSGFHIQHLYELRARCEIDLYEGRTDDMWHRYRRSFRQARMSMMSFLDAFALELNKAEGLVLLAQHPPDASPGSVVRRVRKLAKRMSDERNPIHNVKAAGLRAGAAALAGDIPLAIEELERQIATADRASQYLEAALARIRLAQVSDDSKHRRAGADAEGKLREQGVQRPDRLVEVFLPGFQRFSATKALPSAAVG